MKKPGILALGSTGLAAAALAWLAACSPAPKAASQATATIESRSGSPVTGRAVFTELPSSGTKVEVWIEHAAPGLHGLHLHEKGDCTASDATSAGGHFNASSHPHAGPSEAARHNGDLGNIEIDADGRGRLEITSDLLTVQPGPDCVVGRAVVFHENADDLQTQPTGAAGARFGCGVVK